MFCLPDIVTVNQRDEMGVTCSTNGGNNVLIMKLKAEGPNFSSRYRLEFFVITESRLALGPTHCRT